MLMQNMQSVPLDNVPQKTILIVEDDIDIGEALSAILVEELGLRPLVVTSGLQALQVLTTLMPSLILLDYQLPDMTGFEFHERIHYRGELACIPTVLISANLPPAFELKKRHLHGLAKPFNIDDMVNVVQHALATPHSWETWVSEQPTLTNENPSVAW